MTLIEWPNVWPATADTADKGAQNNSEEEIQHGNE